MGKNILSKILKIKEMNIWDKVRKLKKIKKFAYKLYERSPLRQLKNFNMKQFEFVQDWSYDSPSKAMYDVRTEDPLFSLIKNKKIILNIYKIIYK